MWLQQESKARVFWQCVTYAAGVLSMLSLTVGVLLVLHTVNDVVKTMPQQIAALRTTAQSEIADTRSVLDRQLTATRTDVVAAINRQGSGLRTDTKLELDAYRQFADVKVSDVLARLDAALAQAAALHTEVTPVLEHAASITAHADEASAILLRRDALPAQVLGTLGAAKVTLGETAQTMRTIRDTTPAVAENIKRATDESAKASESAAKLAAHLAKETKPLPTWARVGLAVAPPLAATGASVISLMQLLHFIP